MHPWVRPRAECALHISCIVRKNLPILDEEFPIPVPTFGENQGTVDNTGDVDTTILEADFDRVVSVPSSSHIARKADMLRLPIQADFIAALVNGPSCDV